MVEEKRDDVESNSTASDSRVRPKLLVLTTTFPVHPDDGVPSFVLDVCRGLSTEFEVCVLAPKTQRVVGWRSIDGIRICFFGAGSLFSESLVTGAILENLRHRPLLALQLPAFFLSFLLATILVSRKFRPDVMHAHWLVPAGLIAKLAFPGPRVITAHGGDLYALNGRVALWLKRLALKGASLTVVNSEMARIAQSLGAEGQVRVIPGGPIAIRPPKVKKVAGRIIFVGRLVEKKGLEVLLRAVRGLRCELHVVGDGPLSSKLRSKAPSNVVFHGNLRKTSVMNLMASSEIMVIPSLIAKGGDQEGLPLTLMESTYSNTAVIATNLPGIKDVISDGENGLLVPPGDPASLRGALESLLADAGRRASFATELGKQSHRFSVETVVAQYREVLTEALNRSAGAGLNL